MFENKRSLHAAHELVHNALRIHYVHILVIIRLLCHLCTIFIIDSRVLSTFFFFFYFRSFIFIFFSSARDDAIRSFVCGRAGGGEETPT